MNMPWFNGYQIPGKNGTFYTLFDAMEHFLSDIPETASSTEEFGGSGIVTIFSNYNNGTLLTGKVMAGIVRVGDKVLFHPRSGAVAVISSIGMDGNHEIMSAAKGDMIGIKLIKMEKGPVHRKDLMMVIPSNTDIAVMEPLFKKLTQKVKEFTVKVNVINAKVYYLDTKSRSFTPTIYIGGIQYRASLVGIKWAVIKEGIENERRTVRYEKPARINVGATQTAELIFGFHHRKITPVLRNKSISKKSRDRGPGNIVVTTPDVLEKFSKILIVAHGFELTMDGVVTEVCYESGGSSVSSTFET